MIVLDAKTDYSFMRGFGTPEQWLARCKEIGVTHLGIADYCSTWGHTFFRKAFKGSGIHLIYGVQLPVVGHLDKDPRHSLVTLLATDDVSPLYKLVSLANQQSYYRPRLTWAQVKAFKGIVILNHTLKHHERRANECKNAYVGVSRDMPEHMAKLKGKRVLSYSPRYPGPEERQGFKLFQAISDGQRIGEVDNDALHMLRESELLIFGGSAEEWMINAEKIAGLCTADIHKGTLIESGIKDKQGELYDRAMDGAVKKGLAKLKRSKNGNDWIWKDEAYGDRLDRELSVIGEKKFEDYFFFVQDIVAWAKERMFVGPGRGSAGGSLLCYLLDITSVDPLKFNTMFERFIDITRPDLPDIDIDFPDNRREEVFTYLKEKYGETRVARLGTISEFGGKSAINDTARATGVPADIARAFGRYTEGVGQGIVISPSRIFGLNGHQSLLGEDDQKMLERYPQIKLAAQIDGHARHHGVHAAGVVVTEGNVTDHGSLTKEGTLAMDMRAAEEIGLVKMDALGLRTLAILQDACDMANLDPRSLYNLDWEDTAVYEGIFNKDRVTGIFQFEGHAVRSLLKGLGKMERFDDIAALTSLARPGPLIGGAAENWVKARKGEIEPRELHPSLESTYGVICYQEQMMHIARDIAGFDEPNVNGMRRAVGKKDIDKLKAFREKFVAGAEKNMSSLDSAEELWDELCEFGSYAFNLAHAVEYGMISFMCAWLKLNYPLQFACACLRYAVDAEQGKNLLRELSEEGFAYVPFDPAKSQATWSIIDNKLYGGFDSVRGIGEKTAQSLVAKRDANPKDWMDQLTSSQRAKVEGANTPWATLTYFGDTFKDLYAKPEEFKRPYAPAGFKGPILRVREIPEAKGNYAFLGKLKRMDRRDLNEESRLAKRDGQRYEKNDYFYNLSIEDDTGEIGGTINRYKAQSYDWLYEEVKEGRDFFFRGNIIGEGRRWVFIDNIVELKQ